MNIKSNLSIEKVNLTIEAIKWSVLLKEGWSIEDIKSIKEFEIGLTTKTLEIWSNEDRTEGYEKFILLPDLDPIIQLLNKFYEENNS